MVQIVYGYSGKTKRNEPISPKLKAVLDRAAAAAGVTKIVVFSGGQSSTSRGRVGSSRHNHGDAGDMHLYAGDRKLNFNENRDVFQTFVAAAAAAGATGIGAAENYMGVDSIHVGFGKPVVWGADGKSANAPGWLRDAYNAGVSGSFAFADEPADPTAAAMNPIGGRTLRRGSRGEDVRTLQAYLSEKGYDTRGVDGIFGRNTERAVKQFQEANQLQSDGVVGNQTRAPIAADLEPFSEPAIPRTNGFPATAAAQLPVVDPTQATRKSLGEQWELLRQLGQEPPMRVGEDPDAAFRRSINQQEDALAAMDLVKPATVGQTVQGVDFKGRFDPSYSPIPDNMRDRPPDRGYIQQFLDPNRQIPSAGMTIGESVPVPMGPTKQDYINTAERGLDAGLSAPPVESAFDMANVRPIDTSIIKDRPIERWNDTYGESLPEILDVGAQMKGVTIGDSYPVPDGSAWASSPQAGESGVSAFDGRSPATYQVQDVPTPKPRPSTIGETLPPQVQATVEPQPVGDTLANASTPELLENLGAPGKTLKSIGDLLGGAGSGILRGGNKPSLGSTIGAMASGISLDKGNRGTVDTNNKFGLSDFSGKGPDFNPVSGGSKYNTYKGVNDRGQTVHYYTTDTGRTFVTSVEG